MVGFESTGDAFSIDFKEVFKWITSPLICEKLGVPAQMDSKFKVSCSFMGPDPEIEEEMNKAVQAYLQQHGASN